MRYFLKGGVLLIFAVAFGLVFSPLLTVTLHDALLDFLEAETAKKVTDYFHRTEVSRASGIAALLLFWTAIVFVVDRAFDSVSTKASTTQGQ
jgi:uncharacterized BrkB/YihY/UPF0761 family membrane protein